MRWLTLLVLGVATFLPIGEARACSCMQQSLEDGTAQSQAIFEGTVATIAPNTATQFRGLEVILTVKRAWKGIDSEEVAVITASNSAACGYPFAEGSTHLVYAYRDTAEEPLRVSLCSLTKPIDQAKADLEHLGKPSKTFGDTAKKSASSKDRCNVSAGPHEGTSLGLFALLIAGLALVGRRS
ncbi:MAG: hypothetical protein OES69_02540 [Myxococcales bacterium]|nr:hypothetical protein [Myxococcales bacterium]MDH3842789.1 hypothetical protein [Myxococcales bacterium]